MATVSSSLRHVKAHLQQLIGDEQIDQICRQLNHVWRDRKLNPALSVQLLLLQLLAQVALRGLHRVAKLKISPQAIGKARQLLPLKLMYELVTRHAGNGTPIRLWKGLKLFMADGMSFMTPDTPQLAKRYGKPRNQKGSSYGYPAPKLLALMDRSGFIHKVIALPWARQEFTCLSRLFKSVAAGGLLLGDRGLVSFAHLAMLIRSQIQGCFRLPRWQVVYKNGKGSRRLIKRLGRQDLLVRWTACRCPKWMSQLRWATFKDQELVLRQIGFRVTRKGFRTNWAWIITTLTDPQRYPAQELIELYGQRWQIEVYFRDLKRTLGLSQISAKTVAGARKEVLGFVLLYNLIRGVMQQAAQRQGVDPDRISFIDATRWLLWSDVGDPLAELLINPRRVRRVPPRALKNARHRFAQIKGSSRELSKPPCTAKL